MKKLLLPLLAALCACGAPSTLHVEKAIENAAAQYTLMIDAMGGETLNPRTTLPDSSLQYVDYECWTAGFFPGSMWYLYELTGDKKWLPLAVAETALVDSAKYLEWHHDIGFIIECSAGNALRLTGDTSYKAVIVQAAQSLSTRFRPGAGIIQSWNADLGWQGERGWECPVIVDNMMNLELLFHATQLTGDSTYWKIATTHADRTIENHFRQDATCYHVIDYALADGAIRNKHTAQGYAHESVWSRGQAWAIYGFATCYRFTKEQKYLDQALATFLAMKNNPAMPADKIPYWDMDAPEIPSAPRDASAAAVIASALYEMSQYDAARSQEFIGYADSILLALTSPDYTAARGTNNNFILMHSVGSIPHNQEIDVPLNYADYYFLEAIKRKKELAAK